MNKYISCGIFPTFAVVDISYGNDDWVLLEYDGMFIAGEITHVINIQYQV